MKTIAVITEFNPFHKGHEYFLRTIRERSKADHVIAVMSGDFVQRGEPAIADKYVRTKMALTGGCDLVIELPVRYALGNAGAFAHGAVSLLDSLGVVDELWFGSECGQIEQIQSAAEILAAEPPAFRASLQEHLKAGAPYPKARDAALASVCGDTLSDVIRKPNNILGLEYCIAAKRLNSALRLKTIKRIGSEYDDADLGEGYASALAIRNILAKSDGADAVSGKLPSYCAELLNAEPGFLTADDFSDVLRMRLMDADIEELSSCQDVSADLARRIKNLENEFKGFTDFALLVKSRNYTYSHISRALFSILLKIRPETSSSAVRILGIKDCGDLLKQIKSCCKKPLISGAASMPEDEYETDLFASNLYESLKTLRFKAPFIHEKSRKLIRLPE